MSERLAPPVHGTGVVDLLKALACCLIVLHHLAFYGPMSDHADELFPVFFDGLAQHGRLAVQVFLVLGGYLAARSFSTMGLPCVAGPAGPGGAELLRMA
ncbi:MAG: acyltransferase family protein, partial [Betaproteobacteria bacterium]